mmetsp:Transcript_71257/g.201991  ORF Transcript_71257/g.201991 Transcript_71257/m.201991 type:complete len:419 (+) Transcript_71257:88-1344(+)|eukprot:CAMPEP_0168401154 /NCGR_PEP_ID=MMETSP0228-20121227/22962_1 /TAXON_ID=133427 /ORGANISM="Protoceratium reticulatum, Strain CCCM 535 (=CCMP 1889)" /LENGTH=418 /DNA_ID=CAMNT_0008414707 /DNA_START=81 /DNA_END=1337 /DNA_ORIENTATION=-
MGACLPCLSQPRSGPPWNSFQDAPKAAGCEPIVCVAGLASSTLEQHSPSCWDFLGTKNYEVTYCSIKKLSTHPVKTLEGLKLRLVDGELKDGTPVKCTACVEGCEQRPVAGTAGLSTLNPGEPVPVAVWKALVDALSPTLNVHAFNYDWRRWGDQVYAEQMVAMFRTTVAASVSTGRPRTSVIAHSMGAPVVLYCLAALGAEWTQAHVKHVILVGPAHMGSLAMLPSFAHGPVGSTHTFIPAAPFLEHKLGDLCATWAGMVAEMPTAVGGIQPWPADQVLASTPSRNYCLSDMGQFLTDVAACTAAREFGPALWPGFQKLAAAMKAPPVPTHIVFSSKNDTMAQLSYSSSDLGSVPDVKSYQPGDGTITAASIRAVAEGWRRQGAAVTLHEHPEAVSHKDLIACEFTQKLVRELSTER